MGTFINSINHSTHRCPKSVGTAVLQISSHQSSFNDKSATHSSFSRHPANAGRQHCSKLIISSSIQAAVSTAAGMEASEQQQFISFPILHQISNS